MIIITALIILLLVLPLWHFLWESVFLPSFRLKVRLQLFQLRDELRHIRIVNPSLVSDDVFSQAERKLNTYIQGLAFIDPFVLRQTDRFLKADVELSERLMKKNQAFDAAAPPQVIAIVEKGVRLAAMSAYVNSGGWMVYALPLATAVLCWSKFRSTLRTLSSASDHDVDKIVDSRLRFAD
jgi:hypothetical protein